MTVRARLVVGIIMAVALVAGGLVLERRVGVRADPPVSASPPATGAWDCPHGGGEGWKVWLALANPGPAPVEIRLATASGGAPPQPTAETLEPSTLRYFEVQAPLPGSATSVESFGAEIGAGMVMAAPEGGIAAEPCAREAGTTWSLPEASSLRGEEARLVLHNPFASEAVVDVSLVAGERFLRPGRLDGVLLDPGEARAIDLHHYALGEDALTANVVARLGRVSASITTVSNGGVRTALGVPGPASRWVLPGVGADGDLVVRPPGSREVAFRAELGRPEGPTPFLDLEAVPGNTAEAFPARGADGGIVVEVDGPRSIVAGRRMVAAAPPPPPEDEGGSKGGDAGSGQNDGGDKGEAQDGDAKGGQRKGKGNEPEEEPPAPLIDVASTAGAAEAAPRWLALPATGPDGGTGTLLLQNPGTEPVDVRVSFVGTGGPVGEEQAVSVLGGASVQVGLPPGGPVAAIVDATGLGVVVAQATTASDAFAVSLGVPVG